MKPKEFIEKYNLTKGWRSSYQKEFISDLTSELMAMIEYNKAYDNIKGFDQSVKVISDKWNAISAKTPYGLPEGLWKYFYATVIVPLRDQLCPREMERRKAIQEEKRKQREAYESRKRWEQEFWESLFEERRQRMREFLSKVMHLNSVPTSSFEILGIPDTSTPAEVKSAYRVLAMKHHPDRGGKQDVFVMVTDAYNKCMKWATDHNE